MCSDVFLLLICNALMTYNVEHHFICFFAIHTSFCWGVCSSFLSILKSGWFLSYYWILKKVLCIFSKCLSCVFRKFVFIVWLCILILLKMPFCRSEVFNFNEIQIINYFFMNCVFDVIFLKVLHIPKVF